ncbi:hypothetical protein GCM10019016_133320 [Streptomyces prasinosporus]|uniref:DUF6777 domain-containing protein n=1 Tax=Streptomyces prasinosporus TaxID=68256 RepID=A0ABP6UHU0_9ACTN
MSVEPPSAGRPTGPPSGPLSGPPPPPPSGPPPGGGAAGPPGPRRRPWWRSVPALAVLAAVAAAAVLLAVVFTRSDGGAEAGGGEIFLQAANATGPDPFTGSTAEESSPPPVTPSPVTESGPANEVRSVRGGQPGLYGGTRDVSSCDVERQIEFLREVPDKNEAFASVAGVRPSEVPSHLRSLTPLQLRVDTRVTNHGYRDGAATDYQAVLQAGTAVLVDDRGVPRVRCACGNPLTEPVEQSAPRHTGEPWPGFSPSNVVVVEPAPRPVEEFVVHDPDTGGWFERQPGDTGGKDRAVPPPDEPAPSGDAATPSPPASDPLPSSTPTAPPPPDTGQPSPRPPDDGPTSDEPAPEEPAPEDPTTGEPPASDSPAPPPPASDSPPRSGPESGPTDPGPAS